MPSGYTSALSHLPTDWIIIGAFVVLVMILSLRMGTQVAASLAFAAPVAFYVFNAASGAAFLSGLVGTFSGGTGSAALFGVVFAVFFIMTYRIIGSYGMTGAYPIQAVAGAFSATIILLVFYLQIPALSALWHFGPQVQAIFSEKFRLFWLLGSYAALAFIRR